MSGSAFRVELSPPEARGMTIQFWSGEAHFRGNFATHIHPFLDRLIGAVRVLRDGYIDETIILFLGAPECELRIKAEQGSYDAELWIDWWPNSRRSKFVQPSTLLSFIGARSEIVSAFVAALKQLRDSVDDVSFARDYGSDFPTREYSALVSSLALSQTAQS